MGRKAIGNLAKMLLQSYMQKSAQEDQQRLISERQRESDLTNFGQQVLTDPSGMLAAKLAKAGVKNLGGIDLTTLPGQMNPDATLLSPLASKVGTAETQGDLSAINPDVEGARMGADAATPIGEGSEPSRVLQDTQPLFDIRQQIVDKGEAIKGDESHKIDQFGKQYYSQALNQGRGANEAQGEDWQPELNRQRDLATMKQEVGDSPAAMQADLQRIRTSAEANAAAGAKYRTPPEDARNDKSYQYHRGILDKLAKPYEDQQSRLGRLIESVNIGTPQADALIAPELLTAMAGGTGSGLRMNEAEISRIIGGRSKWEGLRANLQAWSADPSKANSITPDQRKQIRELVTAVAKRSNAAIDIINAAGDAIVEVPDVMSHREIIAAAKKHLQELSSGGVNSPAAPEVPTPGGGGVVSYEDYLKSRQGKP